MFTYFDIIQKEIDEYKDKHMISMYVIHLHRSS